MSRVQRVKFAVSVDSTGKCIHRTLFYGKLVAYWTTRCANGLRKALLAHLYSSGHRCHLRNDWIQHALLPFRLEVVLSRLGAQVCHSSNLSERKARGALRLVHLADTLVICRIFAFSMSDCCLKLALISCLAEFIADFREYRLCQAHCIIVLVSRCVWHHSKFHVSHVF